MAQQQRASPRAEGVRQPVEVGHRAPLRIDEQRHLDQRALRQRAHGAEEGRVHGRHHDDGVAGPGEPAQGRRDPGEHVPDDEHASGSTC
jgi:hypothetical protein